MGGVTGLHLASRYPARVDRLAACDCTGASTPAGSQQWQERIGVASEHGMDALVDVMIARWFPPEFVAANPPVLGAVRQMIRTTPVKGFIGCASALMDFDCRPGLRAIVRPTLFVCGAKDGALGGSKQLNASVPGSTFVELEGAGHLSNLEKPEAFTDAVDAFLG
jgi:3-oxoadipate enol-lactonase